MVKSVDNINDTINELLAYGLKQELFYETDITYVSNRILHLLDVSDFSYWETEVEDEIQVILNKLLDVAYKKGILEENSVVYRDILDTAMMDCLMPRPSEVQHRFWELYHQDKENATDYFYALSRHSNYIRMDRISKNKKWQTNTNYGNIDITINLSKPEKDPKMIALAKETPKASYPKCLLCRENEGFYGNLHHPARSNHRLIKINLNEENWYLQYSPYVYYNEHCIVLKEQHEPMKISKDTFKRLLDFVSLFPHYFLGSNADLPIVGGSILSHDHFQGGHYVFPMMKQEEIYQTNYQNISVGILDWPMSVLHLKGENKDDLINLSNLFLDRWRNYTDETVDVYAYTTEPHNTITPIVRYTDQYEVFLVLRNNRTSEKYPLGIFHPHEEHHHIKKENIGLIEVMGLAVLPARLDEEMNILKDYLLNNKDIAKEEAIKKHAVWAEGLKAKYQLAEENIDKILQDEIGLTFTDILEQCGVFKRDEKGLNAFKKFIHSCID